MCSVPAPACTGCQGVEAALVGSGTTVPLSPNNITFPQLLGVAEQAAHLSQFFEPNTSTPNPMGGQPTHLSTSGGVPPQKANTQVHPEVACGILVQPQQNGHGLQSSGSHVDPTRAAHCSCAGGHTVQALTVTHSHPQTGICARQAIRASQTSECFRGYGISECSKQLRTHSHRKCLACCWDPAVIKNQSHLEWNPSDPNSDLCQTRTSSAHHHQVGVVDHRLVGLCTTTLVGKQSSLQH